MLVGTVVQGFLLYFSKRKAASAKSVKSLCRILTTLPVEQFSVDVEILY